MMQQYFKIKDEYKDCIIMFRLGDFYEMFFDDAKIASKELELTLTGRDCGLEQRAPMCGVPFHSVDGYINRLIKKNYKVAICDQLEDPKEAKGMVKRGVTRVITPGTVTDSSMLEGGENNFIMSLNISGENLGICYCDVSTGSFYVYEIKNSRGNIFAEINKIKPKEIIVSDENYEYLKNLLAKTNLKNAFITPYFNYAFEYGKARKALLEHFCVHNLSGFGCEELKSATASGGALISYLIETQKNSLVHINTIKLQSASKNMALDTTAIRNLELTQTIIDGERRGSLLWLLDKTKTSLGARMLRRFIENPLKDINKINMRLDSVEEIKNSIPMADALNNSLKNIFDLERIISKISYGSLNAKDCLLLKSSLKDLPIIKNAISDANSSLLQFLCEKIDTLDEICDLLERAIDENAGISLRDGGIIKKGYNAEIDELASASENGKQWLANLEAKEKEATGIPKLKIGYNKVFGYFIEVTKSYTDKVPFRYTRKQTLVNCERYITQELKDMEDAILNAHDKRCQLEYAVFSQIRDELAKCISRIQTTANVISYIDVLNSLAGVANEFDYVKPKMTEDGVINIKNGRHPVVEKMTGQSFVPNDILLDNNKSNLLLITGPNMSGKSTYMRQAGLIVLMAHLGSFVPAESAQITIVDRIFTRVGASDDLSSGQSTFMVEMNELANILNNATSKSLLILDEIGRGTSTLDGLSIARATIEYIMDKIGAKTLFATHYHELIEMENERKGIKNYSIAVKEFGSEIIFLHKIINKGTDKSFGVEVARLAGLPEEVTKRAGDLLTSLGKQEFSASKKSKKSPEKANFASEKQSEIVQKIKNIDVNTLAPIEALNILYNLKKEAENE